MNSNELIRRRAGLKTKVTIFAKFLSTLNKDDLSESDIIQLRDRLTRFELILNDFDSVQCIIESQCDELSIDSELENRETFENSYYSHSANAKLILQKHEAEMDENKSRNSDHFSSGSSNVVITHLSRQIKLLTIQLPNFDGKYSMWLEFRDTFSSLIHSNDSISHIQKFHYLRAALKGGAAQIIESLEFTSENYLVAWDALSDRYNNNRLLVNNHVKSLFNLELVSRDSSEGIRKLLDNMTKHLRALQQLHQPTDHWDTLIVYMITNKLDPISVREWENYRQGKDVPSLVDLKTFLKARADLLETIHGNNSEKKPKAFSSRGFLSTETKQLTNTCCICTKDHYIQNCQDFLKLDTNERLNTVIKLKLCSNCLRPGHYNKTCRKGTCKKCSVKHNTLLHRQNNSNEPNQGNNQESETNNVALSSNYLEQNILLSTALVNIVDNNNKVHTVRCLLDSGSQANYITESLRRRINPSIKHTTMTVSGLNQMESKITEKCELVIQSIHNNFSNKISCFIIPTISQNLPCKYINICDLNIPKTIKLADPNFNKPLSIDLLIGSNLFWQLLCVGQISLGRNKPILQKTRLGWLVAGPLGKSETVTTCNFSQESSIQTQLQKFWEWEECSNPNPQSQEEQNCENHFKAHTRRNNEGRFIVTIPFKEPIDKLGQSYELAKRRFLSLEKRLARDHELKDEYVKFIDEHIKLDHMSEVCDQNQNKTGYFMPHHGVFKESTTTKLRTVFDASMASDNGISLNDLQMNGPTIQQELFSILLRFRQHQYVVAGDIAKMYRQVLITPEQRCLQQILWRSNPQDELKTYQLKTVTYGTRSGSFLAIRCLFQLADEVQDKSSEIVDVIRSDFYVDDLLTGADTVEEAASIIFNVSNILKQGCFQLRKFCTNDTRFLQLLNSNDHSNEFIDFTKNESTKILGLKWCPQSDDLMYNINTNFHNNKVTKRTILSSIAQIFDPLGILSPCIINAKLLMQRLWLERVNWDESLPTNIHSFWTRFLKELENLNTLKIKRSVVCKDAQKIEMHGFSDVSEKAFGACIYIRSTNQRNEHYVSLLCSKTKVAPLKTKTLPRLELEGATLLARLAKKVSNSLRLIINKTVLWTDSTIVLGWIKQPPNKLKTFVANRVAQIQESTCDDTWRHVSSKNNPADVLSRGLMPNDLQSSQLWWNGPAFLSKDESKWPCSYTNLNDVTLPDVKNSTTTLMTQIDECFIFNQFSQLTKLKRVIAWVLRFIHNSSKCNNQHKISGELRLIICLEPLAHTSMTQTLSFKPLTPNHF